MLAGLRDIDCCWMRWGLGRYEYKQVKVKIKADSEVMVRVKAKARLEAKLYGSGLNDRSREERHVQNVHRKIDVDNWLVG